MAEDLGSRQKDKAVLDSIKTHTELLQQIRDGVMAPFGDRANEIKRIADQMAEIKDAFPRITKDQKRQAQVIYDNLKRIYDHNTKVDNLSTYLSSQGGLKNMGRILGLGMRTAMINKLANQSIGRNLEFQTEVTPLREKESDRMDRIIEKLMTGQSRMANVMEDIRNIGKAQLEEQQTVRRESKIKAAVASVMSRGKQKISEGIEFVGDAKRSMMRPFIDFKDQLLSPFRRMQDSFRRLGSGVSNFFRQTIIEGLKNRRLVRLIKDLEKMGPGKVKTLTKSMGALKGGFIQLSDGLKVLGTRDVDRGIQAMNGVEALFGRFTRSLSILAAAIGVGGAGLGYMIDRFSNAPRQLADGIERLGNINIDEEKMNKSNRAIAGLLDALGGANIRRIWGGITSNIINNGNLQQLPDTLNRFNDITIDENKLKKGVEQVGFLLRTLGDEGWGAIVTNIVNNRNLREIPETLNTFKNVDIPEAKLRMATTAIEAVLKSMGSWTGLMGAVVSNVIQDNKLQKLGTALQSFTEINMPREKADEIKHAIHSLASVMTQAHLGGFARAADVMNAGNSFEAIHKGLDVLSRVPSVSNEQLEMIVRTYKTLGTAFKDQSGADLMRALTPRNLETAAGMLKAVKDFAEVDADRLSSAATAFRNFTGAFASTDPSPYRQASRALGDLVAVSRDTRTIDQMATSLDRLASAMGNVGAAVGVPADRRMTIVGRAAVGTTGEAERASAAGSAVGAIIASSPRVNATVQSSSSSATIVVQDSAMRPATAQDVMIGRFGGN